LNTAELKEFVALEGEKSDLKTRLKAIESRLGELDESLTKQFIEDGIQSTRIDGRTVYLHRDIYASAKDGDKEAVIVALKECDLSQYVREDYNANLLKAFVREMVHEAEEKARLEGRVLDDPAQAVPARLAETINISTVFSVSSRRS
jgi:predicted nuclease with TOPRIM domain